MQKATRVQTIPTGVEVSSHRVERTHQIGGQSLLGNLKAILVRFPNDSLFQLTDELRTPGQASPSILKHYGRRECWQNLPLVGSALYPTLPRQEGCLRKYTSVLIRAPVIRPNRRMARYSYSLRLLMASQRFQAQKILSAPCSILSCWTYRGHPLRSTVLPLRLVKEIQ